MRDVATRAGVSVQTVSNVVNGRAGSAGAETRSRVERAMRDIGYHRNMSARGLRSARTDTLALLLRDETEGYLADPLTNLITAGIGDVLREAQRGLLIQTVKTGAAREALLTPLLESRVDGALVLLSGERDLRHWYVDRLEEIGIPFVVFDEVLDNPSILSVRAADRDAGRMVTELLLERGRRRIAFIGARNPWAVVEQRQLGYKDALREAGIATEDALQLFGAGWQAEGGSDMTAALLDRALPPDAIVCGSDVLAVGAIQEARRRGVSVPDDLAIAGFDDFAFSSYIEPPLTTVAIPGYQMGQLAAEMVLAEIDGSGPRVRQVVLPVELRVRQSA